MLKGESGMEKNGTQRENENNAKGKARKKEKKKN